MEAKIVKDHGYDLTGPILRLPTLAQNDTHLNSYGSFSHCVGLLCLYFTLTKVVISIGLGCQDF